jgi:hypothetical protein
MDGWTLTTDDQRGQTGERGTCRGGDACIDPMDDDLLKDDQSLMN